MTSAAARNTQGSTLERKAQQAEARLSAPGRPVEARLSRRRKKTISARWEGKTIVILAPAAMGLDPLVTVGEELIARLERKASHAAAGRASDEELQALAEELNRKYLQGKASWNSIVWVKNMTTRWGSCTPNTGRIRISHRLQRVPDYVLHSVIIHELVHTWIPNHGKEFWSWASRAPQLERARGYLEAYQRWGSEGDGPDPSEGDPSEG